MYYPTEFSPLLKLCPPQAPSPKSPGIPQSRVGNSTRTKHFRKVVGICGWAISMKFEMVADVCVGGCSLPPLLLTMLLVMCCDYFDLHPKLLGKRQAYLLFKYISIPQLKTFIPALFPFMFL